MADVGTKENTQRDAIAQAVMANDSYTPKYLAGGVLDQNDPGNIAQYYRLMGGGGGAPQMPQMAMAAAPASPAMTAPAAAGGDYVPRYLPGGALDPNDPGNIARYYQLMGMPYYGGGGGAGGAGGAGGGGIGGGIGGVGGVGVGVGHGSSAGPGGPPGTVGMSFSGFSPSPATTPAEGYDVAQAEHGNTNLAQALADQAGLVGLAAQFGYAPTDTTGLDAAISAEMGNMSDADAAAAANAAATADSGTEGGEGADD